MTQPNVPPSLLGKPSDSPEVQALLRQAGARDPRLPKGDVRAPLDLNDLGLALVFTDEGFLTGKDLATGEGGLILTGITFHSGHDPQFRPFTGELPFGVKFAQSRKDLVDQLGEPRSSNPRRRQDVWRVDGVGAFAKYTEDLGRIQLFGVMTPESK